MVEDFEIGKIYKATESSLKEGLSSHLFYKPPQEMSSFDDNQGYLHENDVIMVLDKLYVQRTKRRISSSFPNGITLKMWHLKVLIDNQIGYVSVWQEEWEEIKQ